MKQNAWDESNPDIACANDVDYNSINIFNLDYDSQYSRVAKNYKPCTRFCHETSARSLAASRQIVVLHSVIYIHIL